MQGIARQDAFVRNVMVSNMYQFVIVDKIVTMQFKLMIFKNKMCMSYNFALVTMSKVDSLKF